MAAHTQRVLHVVDRTGGGVPVAAATYIANSPKGVEHHVLTPFVDGAAPALWRDSAATLHDLGDGVLTRISRVRATAKAIDATVVHAHSSFSGVYARVAPVGRDVRIVYTPHCYSFARKDISAPAERAYRAIEWLLAHRTDTLAACSPGEQSLAQQLGGLRGRTVVVPNVASIDTPPSPLAVRPTRNALRVGMLGRVSAQKDPAEFVRLVDELRARGIAVEPVWIGDGDDTTALTAAGVEVTGWKSSAEVAHELTTLDLYLHSAAWEGFPIAVLDAHASGVPMLVRPIEAFGPLPAAVTTESAGLDALAAAVREGDDFLAWAESNVATWRELLAHNTPTDQRDALRRAWSGQ